MESFKNMKIIARYIIRIVVVCMRLMFHLKFYISLLDFYRFDKEHYVIGRNENMLRIKVKQYDGNYGSTSKKPQRIKIKYLNYWADRILLRESQSVTHAIVTDGIIDSMIHGFDNIILACGPHCSGKTFNITGWSRKCEGIVPRLIENMLALQTDGRRGDEVYAMSCMEIKDNRVFDLLNDDDDYDDSKAKRRRSCLVKNVSKHVFDSSGAAKQMLRKASAKRSTIVREDNDVPPSHVCDFIITFYCWHVSPSEDNDATADSSCAKVHVVELAGVGPHDAKPLKYQIQTNRTAMELKQFLEHVHIKDDGHSIIDYKSPETSVLVKYFKESLSKRRTTLRVFCHIRPELEFLSSNLTVLKFGEALQKLKTSEISIPVSKSEATELQMQMEHLTHEMYLYGNLKGLKSMGNVTAAHYERTRNDVLNFLRFKSDDIVVRKWNPVDAFTILSVFREYYKMLTPSENKASSANRFKNGNGRFTHQIGRFPLKSLPIGKDMTDQAENTRRNVNETLQSVPCCDDTAPTDERQHYWDMFMAANTNTVILKRKMILTEIQAAHSSFETALEHVLDVQGKLTCARDSMDKLRRERRVRGNEQRYDGNMNAIVPDQEKCMFLITKRVDGEMAKAHDEFIRAQTHLNRTMVECSKLDDAILEHFEVFANT